MTRRIDAVFEGGVLRPLEKLDGIAEHTRVKLTVETVSSDGDGLSACGGIMPDEDARELRRIVEDEFERVDEHEW